MSSHVTAQHVTAQHGTARHDPTTPQPHKSGALYKIGVLIQPYTPLYSHIRVRLGAPPLGKDWTARATHEACCVHRRARMLWSMNSLQLSIWPCAKWTLAPLKR